jgi:hypothetical protein
VQISESQIGRAIRTKRWKYGVVAPGKNGLEAPGSTEYVEEFLYDLHSDPYEVTNLIGIESHLEVAKFLKERLLKRMTEAGEEIPSIQSVNLNQKILQRAVRPDEILQ